MRKIALFLLLCPLLATAEEFTDEASGVTVQIPEGWDRETQREQGHVKLALLLDVARGKFVRVTISTGGAMSFSADGWLSQAKEEHTKRLKEVTTPFERDSEKTIGGMSAIGYTVAGKASGEGVHNPDLLRALLEASIEAVTSFYNLGP